MKEKSQIIFQTWSVFWISFEFSVVFENGVDIFLKLLCVPRYSTFLKLSELSKYRSLSRDDSTPSVELEKYSQAFSMFYENFPDLYNGGDKSMSSIVRVYEVEDSFLVFRDSPPLSWKPGKTLFWKTFQIFNFNSISPKSTYLRTVKKLIHGLKF